MNMEKTPIQKLYEKIPSFQCKEGCVRCCDNWIQYAPEEAERCGEFTHMGSRCEKLDEKERCTVYPDRPFICRLFASSEIMPCPYGYGPEQPLTEEETKALLKEYLRLRREQEESYGSQGNR